MFSALVRSSLRTTGSPVSKVIARNYDPSYVVVSGPPRVRVSMAEKVFLGGGMCLSLLVVPTWVLVNIKKWNGTEAP